MSKYSDKQLEHFFHKWLYTYGGATDVKTLEDFIEEYDSGWYGEVDKYDSSECPCILCLEN
jgi:hypothetical protein